MQKNSFDTYAAQYDADFTFSSIGRMQRERVHRYLKERVGKECSVLEINCGTGEDARWLSTQTNKVVATDISEGMIKVCLDKKIPLVQFKVEDSRTISKQFGTGSFDLLFSNFGGLNCLSPDEIKSFGTEAAACLKDKGLLVAVLLGRKCRWERFYFKWKKDARYKRRESREGVETTIGSEKFYTWYYAPPEFSGMLSDSFTVLECRPIGLFVPPSYLEPFFTNKKYLLNGLYAMDKLFTSPSSADYADHYLIVLQKKESHD